MCVLPLAEGKSERACCLLGLPHTTYHTSIFRRASFIAVAGAGAPLRCPVYAYRSPPHCLLFAMLRFYSIVWCGWLSRPGPVLDVYAMCTHSHTDPSTHCTRRNDLHRSMQWKHHPQQFHSHIHREWGASVCMRARARAQTARKAPISGAQWPWFSATEPANVYRLNVFFCFNIGANV